MYNTPMRKKVPAIKESRVVVKDNDLIVAGYGNLTNRSIRLVEIIISAIDNKRDQDIEELELSTKNLVDLLGLDSTQKYRDALVSALHELRSHRITINTKDSTIITGYILSAEVLKRKDITRLKIDGRLKPFLIDLKEFTQHRLGEVLALRGEYAIALYGWLIVNKFRGSKATSGAWYSAMDMGPLRKMLGADDDKGNPLLLKRWPDFRRKAIEKACLEISEKSPYLVSWEAKTKGRKVVTLKFHVTPKDYAPPKSLNLPPAHNSETPEPETEEDRVEGLKLLHMMKHKADFDRIATLVRGQQELFEPLSEEEKDAEIWRQFIKEFPMKSN